MRKVNNKENDLNEYIYFFKLRNFIFYTVFECYIIVLYLVKFYYYKSK